MKTTTKNVPIKKPLLLALSLTVAVGLSLSGFIPSASAHTGCEADLKDLEQTIKGIEFSLEHETKHRISGSNARKRMHKSRVRRLGIQLNGAHDHFKEATAVGCPDSGDALQDRIRQLEHQVDHLTK